MATLQALGLTIGPEKLPTGTTGNTALVADTAETVLTPGLGPTANWEAKTFDDGLAVIVQPDLRQRGSIVELYSSDSRHSETDPVYGLYLDSVTRLLTVGTVAVAKASVRATMRKRAAPNEIHISRIVTRQTTLDTGLTGVVPASTDLTAGKITGLVDFDLSATDDATWTAANTGFTIDTGTDEPNVLAIFDSIKSWFGKSMPASPQRLLYKTKHFSPSMATNTDGGRCHVLPIHAESWQDALMQINGLSVSDAMATSKRSQSMPAKKEFSLRFAPASRSDLVDFAATTDDIASPDSSQWPQYWLVVWTGLDNNASITVNTDACYEHMPPTNDPDNLGRSSYQTAAAGASQGPDNKPGIIDKIMDVGSKLPGVVQGDTTTANKTWLQKATGWFSSHKEGLSTAWSWAKSIGKLAL